jgi:hypothetical protein
MWCSRVNTKLLISAIPLKNIIRYKFFSSKTIRNILALDCITWDEASMVQMFAAPRRNKIIYFFQNIYHYMAEKSVSTAKHFTIKILPCGGGGEAARRGTREHFSN